MPLEVGDQFPPVPVQTREGPLDLSQRWEDGPLVVAFHRMWCPFCQQAAKQLEGVGDELREAGADAVLVYRNEPEVVADACAERATPFTCASDSGRVLEQAAQIDRFRATRYAAFAPTRLVAAIRAGGRLGVPNSALLQGRGTYVVGTDGRVRYAHTSLSAADIPEVRDIVAAVQAA